MDGFTITMYGVNTSYDSATVTKSTLDALGTKITKTFNCTHLNMRTETDLETVEVLSGKLINTKKVSRNTFEIMLTPTKFIAQTNPATYTANRFFEDLFLTYKYHFIFFNNSNVIYNYPYLAKSLNSTTVLTHALQVNYGGQVTVNNLGGALFQMGFNLTTTYNI